MTLWVIGFIVGLFIYIAWGLNAIYRAVDWDPLNSTMSAFRARDREDLAYIPLFSFFVHTYYIVGLYTTFRGLKTPLSR